MRLARRPVLIGSLAVGGRSAVVDPESRLMLRNRGNQRHDKGKTMSVPWTPNKYYYHACSMGGYCGVSYY